MYVYYQHLSKLHLRCGASIGAVVFHYLLVVPLATIDSNYKALHALVKARLIIFELNGLTGKKWIQNFTTSLYGNSHATLKLYLKPVG